MLLGPYKSVKEANEAAKEISTDGSYVINVSDFGIFADLENDQHRQVVRNMELLKRSHRIPAGSFAGDARNRMELLKRSLHDPD